MHRRRSTSAGQAAPDQHAQRLFNLYDVQKNGHVCISDFDFVHSLAIQFMCGGTCDLTPVTIGSSNGSLKGSRGKTNKPCLLRSPLPELYAKAIFSDIDLDSDRSLSRNDFHTWLAELMRRMGNDSGDDQKASHILIQHLIHMLQADARYLAYRSLALSARRAAAEQGNSRQILVAITAFKEALGSAEKVIKDDVLTPFRHQLTERQLDLKNILQTGLGTAQTLHDRESALREMMQARSVIILEPSEVRKLKQYQDTVKTSYQPFIVHVTTLAGPEARIEASHGDTVWSLRARVAAELNQGQHAYQTTLSNMRGKLEDDSATLGECLLCSCEGEELVATYTKANRWVELSHPEFEEFRCKESHEAACLQRAAEELEKKAKMHKSPSNIVEALVKKAEVACHKTWQKTTFEDILIETVAMFSRDYGRHHKALKRMVRGLRARGLVEE